MIVVKSRKAEESRNLKTTQNNSPTLPHSPAGWEGREEMSVGQKRAGSGVKSKLARSGAGAVDSKNLLRAFHQPEGSSEDTHSWLSACCRTSGGSFVTESVRRNDSLTRTNPSESTLQFSLVHSPRLDSHSLAHCSLC